MSPVPMNGLGQRIVSSMDAYRGENMEFAAALQSLPDCAAEQRFRY
jgi:hypothetical protein